MRLGADEVRKIRERTNLSQNQFCAAYGIPYGTLVTWEWNRRQPNETSSVYLRLIEADPEGMAQRFAALGERKSASKKRAVPRLRLAEAAA